MNTQACCSHSKITRHRQEYPGGCSEYWQCDTCETRFFPEPADMSRRKLRQQLSGKMLQGLVIHGDLPYNKLEVAEVAIEYADVLIQALDK